MMNDEEIQRRFSEQLTEYRERKGLSKAELARRAGMSSSAITQYEQGKKAPSIINVRRLAKTLDISVNDLCGTDAEEEWKESPVKALLTALDLFQFQVLEIGDDMITLGIRKEDCAEYSSSGVKAFFKKYKVIQAVEDIDLSNMKLKPTLIEALASEFDHLPGYPNYCGPVETAAET